MKTAGPGRGPKPFGSSAVIMRMEAALVFPHQLYKKHPAVSPGRLTVLFEDPLYFSQYKFHKQKLLLHRASMKYYAGHLQKRGWEVAYIECTETDNPDKFFNYLKTKGVTSIHYADTTDYLLERRLNRFGIRHRISLKKYDSPGFLLTDRQFDESTGPKPKYFMANFYIQQRKRFGILLENDTDPAGGKWSFDTENRKRMPSGLAIPPPFTPPENTFTKEARQYVKAHFDKNYGQSEIFTYPVTHEDADKVLNDFLINRMTHFGTYEDAILSRQSVLFHSILTPALNTGLLTPDVVINRTLEFHEKYQYPLNSLEGFIRQIIGWREFIRGLYVRQGVFMRTTNYLNFNLRMPESFWMGNTGIEPVDRTIHKVLQTGYCHHIERLMILGNFFHLCGFHPDDVYRWFMELFIDSYDWVMVPNVYGMSQYSAGSLMTTKPYISGSNYILKMSDYKKGEWSRIWDALYWRYIMIYQDIFSRNPRMNMVYGLVSKMPQSKKNEHLDLAEKFLASL